MSQAAGGSTVGEGSITTEDLAPILEQMTLGELLVAGTDWLGADNVAKAVREAFDTEGKKRAKVLADNGQHLAALAVAIGCCRSKTICSFAEVAISAHSDPGDEVRQLIAHQFAKVGLIAEIAEDGEE